MSHIYEHTVLEIMDDNDRAAAVGAPGEDPGLTSMDIYTTEIMQILAYLKRYARALSIQQSTSARDIDIALKIMRELRLTIESLAEFQGRISSKSHTTINIESMNMRLLSITNVIRTRLCPKCRQEMLAAITEVENQTSSQTIVPEITSNTCQQ